MVERRLAKAKVAGSIPVSRLFYWQLKAFVVERVFGCFFVLIFVSTCSSSYVFSTSFNVFHTSFEQVSTYFTHLLITFIYNNSESFINISVKAIISLEDFYCVAQVI